MVNHIISYEIAAIPIFVIIIMASISRRLTKGRINRILFWIVIMSLFSTVSTVGKGTVYFCRYVTVSLPFCNNSKKCLAPM